MDSIPVTIHVGDERHIVNMTMQLTVEPHERSEWTARIDGDAMASALLDRDLPGFLRALADRVEQEQNAESDE